jgi:release factor glutamine methyltransferase
MGNSISDLYKSIVLEMSALFLDEEARAIADRLFEHYFLLSPIQRVLAASELAPDDKSEQMKIAVSKVLNHVPLQYVIGKAWFMDLEYDVNESVLIPRPETEEMVSLILKSISVIKSFRDIDILDIGTGSGCIAISLKKNLPHSGVSAVDISKKAIAVAERNAFKNEVKVNFMNVDILDSSQWHMLPECNLIVSNPPYVTESEKLEMKPNVINNEPHTALFVPDDDPLLFYRSIMMFAKAKLIPGGTLWLEINEAFGQDVVSLFENEMFKERILLKDMFGKHRFVKVTK